MKNKIKNVILLSLPLVIIILAGGAYFYYKQIRKINQIKRQISQNKEKTFLSGEAVKMYNNDQLDNLINILQKKLKQDPDNSQLLLLLAQTYLQKSNLDYDGNKEATKARVYIEKVLSRHKNLPQAVALLGYSYEVENNYNKAIEQYKKAIQLDPKNYYYYNKLGHVYELNGNDDLVLANYEKALVLNNKAPEVHANLARIYTEEGKVDTAIKYYQEALKYTHNKELQSGIYASLGNIYGTALERNSENKAKALGYFQEALKLNPKNALAYANLEHEYFIRLGEKSEKDNFKTNLKKIEEYLNKAIKINPYQSQAYLWGALTLISVNDIPQAIAVINSGIEAVQNNNTLFGKQKDISLARFYMIKSVIYAQNPNLEGNMKYSLKYLQKALEKSPYLVESFVIPQLQKGKDGYFNKIKNNSQFKEIINNYKNKIK